ncbi:MAG: putative membrane protein [Alphaproteobacteria bacterium]|jgi:uncharacterized membrane protein
MPENNTPQPDNNEPSQHDPNIGNDEFNGFNGKYDFNIKEIFKRAYTLSSQNNWTLVLALACIWVATFAIYLLYIDAFGITDLALLVTQETPLTQTQQVMIELTLTFVLAPLWAGITMLAISTQRKTSLPVFSIFQYYRMLPALALASICIDIMFTFGFTLFFIPGFYVFAATTFTLPLIADMNMKPIKAIICSIKMSNLYLLKMLQLYLLFLVMLFVVLISFGFAYLWIGPLYFNVKAVLYQDLFCAKEPEENTDSSSNKGVFNA